jgi:uncharacterized membrane protein YfcA
MLAFYILALAVVFLGTIINLPGSLHINPLLLHFYEPHKVLFLTLIFLALGALARIFVFWKLILWREAITLGVWGLFGGFFGGYFVGYIPQKIIVYIFFITGIWYLYTFFAKKEGTKPKQHSAFISGFVTAFMQSYGLSVGVLRQGYLFSKGYDLPTVQGTIAVVFLIGSFGTILARAMNEHFLLSDTLPILGLFPFMLITVYVGKKIIYKMPKKLQDVIIIYSLILSLLLAVPYLFS